jgi:hypothetical protein
MQALLKSLFYAAIFAGMKGQNHNLSSGFKAVRQMFKQGFQSGELLVYFDAECLKNPAYREGSFLFRKGSQHLLKCCGQLGCTGEDFSV